MTRNSHHSTAISYNIMDYPRKGSPTSMQYYNWLSHLPTCTGTCLLVAIPIQMNRENSIDVVLMKGHRGAITMGAIEL